MKSEITRIIAVAIAAFTMAQPAAAGTEELPVRKSGQWKISTVSDTTGLKEFETCLTPNDSIVPSNDKECGKPDVKRKNDEIFVNVACKSSAGNRRISTLLTGDFSTWYRAVSKITLDPPQGGYANLGVIVDGKYLGPTCKDDKAGQDNEKK